MFNTVFRSRTVNLRSFHASSSCLSGSLTRSRISNLLAILSKETHEPLWDLINRANSSHPSAFGPGAPFHERRVLRDELTQWKSTTSQRDIGSALETLRNLQSKPIPHWLIFYIVIYKVRSSANADGPMMDFLFAQLDLLPLDLRGTVLVFAVLHLAKFNLLQPLKHVVNTFLTTELSHDSLQFNLLLQALSFNSVRSTASANIVVQILNVMEGRQLKLRPETYHALLNDRFITMQLTKYLRSRMIHEGVVPDVAHLEAYLRVFAKGGAIHEAQSYFNAIRKHKSRASDLATSEGHEITVAMSAFKDRASAFEFLRDLAPVRKNNSPPAMPPSPYLLPLNKKKLDTHDYTASLSVAARDTTIRTGQFIRMFRRMGMLRGSSIRPTIVSYTVVIRGLLYRNAIPPAERLWNELMNAGYALDRPALTVGLETLTRARRPHEAFELLEKHALKSSVGERALRPFARFRIDVHTLNSFMEALNKMKRPDVAFKLWEHMGELYDVNPTSETLSILLQAARIACQLDNTFHGAVAHLSLRNPFRKSAPRPITREEVSRSITSILGDKNSGLIKYSSGIWNDELPFHAVRRVFLQVIFGNAYDQLTGVTPPAFALRSSIDTETSFVLPSPVPVQRQTAVFEPSLDLLNSRGRSRYPHIIPTNDNFLQYIILLGLDQRAGDIPITLAWMRASGIRPDRATLAVALVFWSEVSVHAPLVESWTGGEGKSQFTRLVEWMHDWVGKEKMPTADNVSRWLHRSKRMKEGEE
ncbi:hypothetical protein APHAL10511_002859 [Amanita phalloides]|nr:hypothetical protein APHAL10511_002859 [Amanita phalloides]